MEPKKLQHLLGLHEEPILHGAVLIETIFDYITWGNCLIALRTHTTETMPGKVYNAPTGGQVSHEQIKILRDHMKGSFIQIPCPVRLDGQDKVTNIWSFIWSGNCGDPYEVRLNLDMVEGRFPARRRPTADDDNPERRREKRLFLLQSLKPMRPHVYDFQRRREHTKIARKIAGWTREILIRTRVFKTSGFLQYIEERARNDMLHSDRRPWEDIPLQEEIEPATRPWHIPLRHRAAGGQQDFVGWKSNLTDVGDSLCDIDITQAIYRLANQKSNWKLWVELGTTIMVSIMSTVFPPSVTEPISPVQYPDLVFWFPPSDEAYLPPDSSSDSGIFFCEGSMEKLNLRNLLRLPEEPVLIDGALIEAHHEYKAWGDHIASLHMYGTELLFGKVYVPSGDHDITRKDVARLKRHMNGRFVLVLCRVLLDGEGLREMIVPCFVPLEAHRVRPGNPSTLTEHLKTPIRLKWPLAWFQSL